MNRSRVKFPKKGGGSQKLKTETGKKYLRKESLNICQEIQMPLMNQQKNVKTMFFWGGWVGGWVGLTSCNLCSP